MNSSIILTGCSLFDIFVTSYPLILIGCTKIAQAIMDTRLRHPGSLTPINHTNKSNEEKLFDNHTENSNKPIQMMTNDNKYQVCPYGCCKINNIADYIYSKGFLDGCYSDVTIEAFGKSYKLHKLLLMRSEYFKSLFAWPQHEEDEEVEDCDNNNTYTLKFEGDDYCTQQAFELAIRRLYGSPDLEAEKKAPYNMIAVGQYLGISDVVCIATEYIVGHMTMENIVYNLQFATSNNYGSASERIMQNAKGILCCDGWQCGPEAWKGIPASVSSQVVGQSYFFVPNEWDRCLFIVKLIQDSDDAAPLRKVLNDDILYCNMTPDQLQDLELLRDRQGNHIIDPEILHNALWRDMQLRRLVINASDIAQLGKTVKGSKPPSDKWYQVPSKDDTATGLPAELDEYFYTGRSEYSKEKETEDDTKTTQGQGSAPDDFVWTKIPPFRCSVSFANVSELVTNKRVYAKTFWYAGSYWNLYLQKNRVPRKHTYQIGVYLHRASRSSLVGGFSNTSSIQHLIKSTEELHIDEDLSDSDTDINSSPLKDQRSDETLELHRTPVRSSTYEDQRSVIRVYFIISTPSRRLKPAISSFLSVPNNFSRSQSWGWKSNSMCIFNEDGTFPAGDNPNLKFMIVLGNV